MEALLEVLINWGIDRETCVAAERNVLNLCSNFLSRYCLWWCFQSSSGSWMIKVSASRLRLGKSRFVP